MKIREPWGYFIYPLKVGPFRPTESRTVDRLFYSWILNLIIISSWPTTIMQVIV